MNEEKISKTELTKEIANASSLSRGDVSSIIENRIDIIPKYLLMGKSVNLGELGIFRISFGSEGVDKTEDFSTSKIGGVKIAFTPGTILKEELDNIRFE